MKLEQFFPIVYLFIVFAMLGIRLDLLSVFSLIAHHLYVWLPLQVNAQKKYYDCAAAVLENRCCSTIVYARTYDWNWKFGIVYFRTFR